MRKTLGTAVIAALALTGIGLANGGTANANTVRPSMEAPQPDPAPITTRVPSRFQLGTWFDTGIGNVFVAAPLQLQDPCGAWVRNRGALVQVQEFSLGRWVVRATLRTNRAGVAAGMVHLGGGVHYLRVVHPRDARTTATTGRTRRVVITTEPLDIV
jgi:hypothetical protein